MQTVIIQKRRIANQFFLELKFPYDREIIIMVKTIPGIRYNGEKRSWMLHFCPENIELVEKTLQPFVRLEKRIQEKDLYMFYAGHVSEKISKFEQYLRNRRYSPQTIETYSSLIRTFFGYYKQKEPEQITQDDIIQFNDEYIISNELSQSYQNQFISGIKLFFGQIEGRGLDVEFILRPRREHRLPNVLSKEEVKLIIAAPVNLKHRCMLSLIYSCGLRSGELLRLLPEHIDSKRNLIMIRQSKGKKDRIVPLSLKILELLREYYLLYKPQRYLFEGMIKGQPYDQRSLQQVLKQALKKAGIKKPVTLHWLRHSYATHLLESGTDLRYIQELLGHSSSRTTEIYTHVSNQSIQKIVSPFDSL